jgi:hypothetical protein
MSSDVNPFIYFEKLVDINHYNQLRDKFINDIIEHSLNPSQITRIDKEKGIIFYFSHEGEFSYKFETEIKTQYYIAKRNFELGVHNILSKGNSPQAYINHYFKLFEELEQKILITYRGINLIKTAFSSIVNFIKSKYLLVINSEVEVSREFVEIDRFHFDSFSFSDYSVQDVHTNITRLYTLCVENEPSIIACNKNDFISAFSQKTVESNLNWLAKSKNGLTSKSSLFYFLDCLINEEIIEEPQNNSELYKKIQYVFRDALGNKFKNLKQSNYQSSTTNPAFKSRIDFIIRSISELS